MMRLLFCLCEKLSKGDKIAICLALKEIKIQESVERRKNPSDDIKSAAGEIYIGLKQILQLKQCGNKDIFTRYNTTPLITPDTAIYKELEKEILLD